MSPEEFDRIIRPIERQMMQTVWHVLGDTADAEDALQDALITVLKRWKRVTHHDNPHVLIIKICANCAYDQLRQRVRLSRRSESLDNAQELSCVMGPSQQLLQRELRTEIMCAISKLSRNQALAFLLRSIQEQSYDDIAAAMDCSAATARKHVARARDRLTTLLHHLAPTKGDSR